jgi:hypothetical protein
LRDSDLLYTIGVTHTLAYTSPLNKSELKATLNAAYALMRMWSGDKAPDQLVAWLPRRDGPLGSSNPRWSNPEGLGRVTFCQTRNRGPLVMAHELAHNLGRRHPNTPDACNARDSGTDWPYENATIQEYGFDPLANSGLGEVKNAKVISSVMSYCADPSAPEASVWVSPFTYRELFAGEMAPRAAVQGSGTAEDVLMVSGTIHRDGTGALRSVYRTESTYVPTTPQPGLEYCLEMQTGEGLVLQTHCFDVDFLDHFGDELVEETFFFLLPLAPGTQQLELKHDVTTLDIRSSSTHTPVVAVTSPTPGASWEGTQTIEWTTEDDDGDDVTSSLVYSHDDGASWVPLGVDVNQTSLEVDTERLPGGDEALIRIIASDGFNTTSVDVGPFAVARKGPRPVILSPEAGSTFAPGASVLLEGDGYDPEDGAVDDSAFSWFSDIDGALGTGAWLQTGPLSEGTHQITLMLVDSDGDQGTDSIILEISVSEAYLPLITRPGRSGWITVLEEGFEGSFPASWNVFDTGSGPGEYAWGKRNCQAFSGSYSGWAVGGGANGPGLACGADYPHNVKSWMIHGPFSLADATAADLSFKVRAHTEVQDDYVFWGASTNGTSFFGPKAWGNSQGWVQDGLDLTSVPGLGDVTGQSQVWIAFLFASDDATSFSEGAHVDDIVLRKYVPGMHAAGLPSGGGPDKDSNPMTKVSGTEVIGRP